MLGKRPKLAERLEFLFNDFDVAEVRLSKLEQAFALITQGSLPKGILNPVRQVLSPLGRRLVHLELLHVHDLVKFVLDSHDLSVQFRLHLPQINLELV